MIRLLYIGMAVVMAQGNCSKKRLENRDDCAVYANVINYLKEHEPEVKAKGIAVFYATDALNFSTFREEIQAHHPDISSKSIDSLDYAASKKIKGCNNIDYNPEIEVVFSNRYRNLILCEWFYRDDPGWRNNLLEMRRFKTAPTFLFELDESGKIKQVYKETTIYD